MLVSSATPFFVRYFLESRSPVRSKNLPLFWRSSSGGPSEDSQRRWWLSLRESHLRFKIGDRERKA